MQQLGHYGEKNTPHAVQDPHNDRLAAHYPLLIFVIFYVLHILYLFLLVPFVLFIYSVYGFLYIVHIVE